MKRLLSLALVTACALALAVSCAKPEPQIDIDMSHDFSVSGLSETITLSFISNTDWVVSSSENWCKPSPAAGSGSSKTNNVTLSVDPNPSYEYRSATITVKAGDLEKTVTLKQDPALGILVDNTTIEVAATGGRISIPVKANIDYAINASADWIYIADAPGSPMLQDHLVDYVIVLDCAGNSTGETRTATVTLEGPGVSATITVVQAASEYITIVSIRSHRDDMELAPTDLITIVRGWGGAGYRQAEFTARFTTELTDCDFDLLCADDAKGWVTKLQDAYYDQWSGYTCLYFQIEPNPSTESRTGHIRIVDKNTGYVSNELTVYQIGKPEHAIDMGTYVYWHEFNLGASSPEGNGDYYAWGELEPKATYTWDNYYWAGSNKYTTIEHYSGGGTSYKPGLDYEDDAAAQKLGYKGWTGDDIEVFWHIPSQWDFQELLDTREHPDTHKWEWKTINGHAGWQITYLVNGNTLFLPAAGYIYEGGEVSSAGTIGLYWTSANRMPDNTDCAYFLNIESGDTAIYQGGQKAAGYSIRPVTY